MAFVKGQSGNPGGRSKGHSEMLELARKCTARNLEVLEELRDSSDDDSVRAQCAKILHEIGWGKPTQQEAGDSLTTLLTKISDGHGGKPS